MGSFCCSTKIYASGNALEVLRTFSARRVLVVTDRYFSESGKALQIAKLVPGAQIEIFDQVTPDPPASLAAKGAALCRKFEPDLLLALGGGSPMDCAKAIKLAYGEKLLFVAVPTTSGSGSEMTSFSILTHKGVKHPLIDETLRPDAAILDASLLQNLPSALIADTGMDLLAHCVEALVAKGRTGCSDAMALLGARTVLKSLERSFRGDTSVRLELHEAASMAGLAFDNAGLGVCHALAHAIGGVFHIPHGRLCSVLLPEVIAYNRSACLSQYALLAKICELPAATDRLAVRNLIFTIARLQRSLLLPQTLGQAGIAKQQWEAEEDAIVQAALKDPCCRSNPVAVTKEALLTILKAVRP